MLEVSILNDAQSDRCELVMTGKLSVSSGDAFLETAAQCHAQNPAFAINLADVSYLDSHGLGLLVQLRERYPTDAPRVIIVKRGSPVEKALDTAYFQDIFAIQPA